MSCLCKIGSFSQAEQKFDHLLSVFGQSGLNQRLVFSFRLDTTNPRVRFGPAHVNFRSAGFKGEMFGLLSLLTSAGLDSLNKPF